MSKDIIYRDDGIKAIESDLDEIDALDPDAGIMKACIRRAVWKLMGVPSADRPQGEWIRTGRTNIYGGIEVQCSNCGDKVMVQHLEDEWYCRHCGTDMGMKGADDE